MAIVVKNQKVNMPKGFTGSYAEHVIRIGIKRALQNKTQKAKKLAKKIEREFSNDPNATQFESSQGTRLPGRSGGKVEQFHENSQRLVGMG
jgi:hypothetical protein